MNQRWTRDQHAVVLERYPLIIMTDSYFAQYKYFICSIITNSLSRAPTSYVQRQALMTSGHLISRCRLMRRQSVKVWQIIGRLSTSPVWKNDRTFSGDLVMVFSFFKDPIAMPVTQWAPLGTAYSCNIARSGEAHQMTHGHLTCPLQKRIWYRNRVYAPFTSGHYSSSTYLC